MRSVIKRSVDCHKQRPAFLDCHSYLWLPAVVKSCSITCDYLAITVTTFRKVFTYVKYIITQITQVKLKVIMLYTRNAQLSRTRFFFNQLLLADHNKVNSLRGYFSTAFSTAAVFNIRHQRSTPLSVQRIFLCIFFCFQVILFIYFFMNRTQQRHQLPLSIDQKMLKF